MSDSPLRFVAHFNNRYVCEVIFDIEKHRASSGAPGCHQIHWRKKGPPSLIPQYLEWMHTVNQEIADRIDDKILYATQTGPGQDSVQLWEYAPRAEKKRIK